MEEHKNLLGLPSEIIEQILSYCSYDCISNLRLVCKFFDSTGQHLLNQGFTKVDKYHAHIQKLIKGKLPRRESERRNHALAKHVNALSAIETRLSLLNMTYMKYIDMGMCCFIPGKVLDELFIVLRALEDVSKPPRTHELLQELRDISSMAMEHFDDKIVPVCKKNMSNMSSISLVMNTSLPVPSTPITPAIGGSSDGSPSIPISWSLPTTPTTSRHGNLRHDILQIRNNMKAANSSLLSMKKEMADSKDGVKDQNKKHVELEKRLHEQNRIINDQNQRLVEQEKKLQDVNQALMEYDHKFNELYREIARLRTELGMESSAIVDRALVVSPMSEMGISIKSEKIESESVNSNDCKEYKHKDCIKSEETAITSKNKNKLHHRKASHSKNQSGGGGKTGSSSIKGKHSKRKLETGGTSTMNTRGNSCEEVEVLPKKRSCNRRS